MLRLAKGAAFALAACCGIAFAAPPDDWAGVYRRQFQNGLVTGEKYQSEDLVEIVPVGQGNAYVRAELQYFNGHSCSVWVVMKETPDGLEYRAGAKSEYPNGCVLRLTRKDGQIVFSDEGDLCRSYACGARGVLNGVKLPIASKRKIKYLGKVRGSEEYKGALIEAGRN